MSGWVNLLLQIVDYFVKAMAHFTQTPEGKKEWDDIESAWEMLANNEDNAGSASYSVSGAEQAVQSTRKAAVNVSSGDNQPAYSGKPSS